MAQVGPPKEVRLNKIVLGSNCIEVLKAFGIPHYFGPAKNSAADAMTVLDPPPIASDMSAFVAAASTTTISSTGAPTVDQVAERLQHMTIWMYVGNGKTPNPNAGWTTYVFFAPQGTVQAIAVTLTKPTAKPPIETDGGVTFGTRLMDMVSGKRYDWPEPLRKIDNYLFCDYPRYNVTYAVSSTTRRVVGIAIGLPIAIADGGGTGH